MEEVLGTAWQGERVPETLSQTMVSQVGPWFLILHILAASSMQSLVADYGKGCYAWSTDGRKHLDMATGIGVLSTGHCHPKVVAAIQEQAGRMIMAQQNIFPASRPMIDLIERFRDIMPEGLSQYIFVSSGSEAVDNAIKIARNATGRPNIITFDVCSLIGLLVWMKCADNIFG